VSAQLSDFARSLTVETAFTVLGMARALKAEGKDVVELEIGDSPFDSTAAARAGGVDAIKNNQSHYCPSPGIPEFRQAAADFVRSEFDIPAQASNIVAGPGAKVFEQFFCETFLNPGDGVLVFSPYFPTYLPNIERRGARVLARIENPYFEEHARRAGNRMAQANIRERLQLFFDAEAGIEVRIANGRYIVEMEMPYRTAHG